MTTITKNLEMAEDAVALVLQSVGEDMSIKVFHGGEKVPEHYSAILYGIAWAIANDHEAIIELNNKAYEAMKAAKPDINEPVGNA